VSPPGRSGDDTRRHDRITELFQLCSQQPVAKRRDYLRQECDDASLIAEVEELLALDIEEPLIDPAASVTRSASGSVTFSGELLVGPDDALGRDRERRTGVLASLLLGNRRQRVTTATIALAALALGSYWVHGATRASLANARAGELSTVRDAVVQAVEIWVEERMVEAHRWTDDRAVVEAVSELARLAGSAPPPASDELVRHSPAQQALVRATHDFFERGTHIVAYNREGRALTSLGRNGFDRGWPGRQVNPRGMELLYRTIERGGVFLASFSDEAVIDNTTSPPYTWAVVPVADQQGRNLGIIAFGQGLSTRFSDILSVGTVGRSGETYAFDETGVILSELRNPAQLAALGVVPDGASSAILSARVRDPGGDLAAGYVPDLPLDARRFTAAAARAIGSRTAADPDARYGVIMTPYRNYAGADVVGAWRWLPEYGFGVVTEMRAREAFAPLRYLQIILVAVAGALFVALAAAFISSVTTVRLRHQVHEARRLGHYTLLEKIGEGGMATVYRARHSMLKRPTAVKVLRPEQTTHETLVRFEREVQLAANLTHPNTVEIHDYGRAPDGTFYYAMEYVDGITLDQLVDIEGEVSPGRAVFIMEQVCGSLAEAHAGGLVHRDIKPLNIMLCQRGLAHDVVKVLDFGLVKSTLARDTKQLTKSRGLRGTLLYMAPERVSDPDNVDGRADIFAVGAVLYFLLTGRHAFDGEGDVDMLYRVVNQDPPPPSAIARQSIPAALDQLVMRCLAKEPNARPSDVVALAEMLRSIDGAAPWTQADADAWWSQR